MTIEKLISIGNNRSGILSIPNDQKFDLILLLANVGLTHRIGPFRQYVDLARCSALNGVCAFRFDLSGYGDSDARSDFKFGKEGIIADFQEVMNALEKQTKVSRFVVLGNCLGADHAHYIAVADSRIRGAIFIDGFMKQNVTVLFWYYAKRLFHFSHWKDYFIRHFLRKKRLPIVNRSKEANSLLIRTEISVEQMRKDLEILIERNVHLFFIYTGHVDKWINRAEQFTRNFKELNFKNLLYIKFFEKAGHTFFVPEHRTELVKQVCDWIKNRFQSSLHDISS